MIKQFCTAFISAFEYHKNDFVWTNDSVLGTTVIESYIYPFIAKHYDLYLIRNFPADGTLYDKNAVDKCLTTGKGYPDPDSALAVIEHENKYKTTGTEMQQLVNWNRQLNVLITYCPGSDHDQLNWLSETFGPKIANLEFKANTYLCILPSDHMGNKTKPFREWWRFFEWNKQSIEFEQVSSQP
ncbi:MAG: hypothetical protein HY881_20145 [Deltaproteobacteria bacterium]|nr:hypothetical protein [Deltaproteobacteria bacterium]